MFGHIRHMFTHARTYTHTLVVNDDFTLSLALFFSHFVFLFPLFFQQTFIVLFVFSFSTLFIFWRNKNVYINRNTHYDQLGFSCDFTSVYHYFSFSVEIFCQLVFVFQFRNKQFKILFFSFFFNIVFNLLFMVFLVMCRIFSFAIVHLLQFPRNRMRWRIKCTEHSSTIHA